MYSESSGQSNKKAGKKLRKLFIILIVLILVAVGAVVGYKYFTPTPVEKAVEQLQFDTSVSESEKQTIKQAIQEQSKTYQGTITASAKTTLEPTANSMILSAYVPVTNKYATRQIISVSELESLTLYVSQDIDQSGRTAIATLLGIDQAKLTQIDLKTKEIEESAVAFIPANQISPDTKLLTFEGSYYLDAFQKGAIYREASFAGDSATNMQDLKLNSYQTKDDTLKVNITGVTALTRVMMTKLASVKDPLYFSELIGGYLADADITHVSNEVSFKKGCEISYTVFCSPPEMIEVLKDSGVDLVELTGNHNNDTGSQYNTETINLYKSLGWQTIGGGLNTEEAAKFYTADQKGSKISFLAYNYPDSPNGNAISGADKAGANSFDFDRITTEIETAKKQSNFVVVNVQFWECYAYPDGFVEFPQCDSPIPDQKEVFRKLIDLGADMVIGSSAHQPQTYEQYNGKPIYYGLGNLYFDQTQWPGTERGIILSHYFAEGKLLQTKLAPTVFGTDLQTRLMTNEEALSLLERLRVARVESGL